VMVSGNPAKVADLLPVFQLWGKTIVVAGNRPGAAQTMKLTSNMLCAVTPVATSEAITMSGRAGIPADACCKSSTWNRSQFRDDARLRGGVDARDRQHVVVQPPLGGFDPGFEPVAFPVLYPDQHNPCRLYEQSAQVAVAAPRDWIVRSPVEICLGTNPSQAPKSRPLENTSPVLIAATMALEIIGPMPGTVIRREHA
jgi:hypothetical protein